MKKSWIYIFISITIYYFSMLANLPVYKAQHFIGLQFMFYMRYNKLYCPVPSKYQLIKHKNTKVPKMLQTSAPYTIKHKTYLEFFSISKHLTNNVFPVSRSSEYYTGHIYKHINTHSLLICHRILSFLGHTLLLRK